MKGLGFQSEEVKISGFDVRDALVGHAVSYEFDLEIDKKVLPIKLLEDVNRWEYVDLPIFQVEQPNGPVDENGLVPMRNKKKSGDVSPVLAPFQLAGPMELWIQDANDMRLSLPVSKKNIHICLYCSKNRSRGCLGYNLVLGYNFSYIYTTQ